MKKTQQLIFIEPSTIQTMQREDEVFKIVEGFKAIEVVYELNEERLRKVFRHNKSCVAPIKEYLPIYDKYNPIFVTIFPLDSFYKRNGIGLNNFKDNFVYFFESKGIDIGDHASENADTSKVSKAEFLANCKMCKIAENRNDVPEGVLYESENFFVDPTIGAFADGYVMIVPKKHVTSFAELSDDEFEEFLDVLDDMKFILESVYGKKIFLFEGGSGKGGEGKHITSIVHAHIHLVPSDIPIMEEVEKNGVHPRLIRSSRDSTKGNFMKEYAEDPYLLIIDQEDNWYIEDNQQVYYPRQFPRMLLAEYMGLKGDAYNWRVNPMKERIVTISEHIQLFLLKNFKKLPARIQNNTIKHL